VFARGAPALHSFLGCALHTNPLLAEGEAVTQAIRDRWCLAVADAEPIPPVVAFTDPSPKTRMGPSMGTRGQAMLDRIVMDVVDVSYEVFFVADLMLPESLLPDASLAMPGPNLPSRAIPW